MDTSRDIYKIVFLALVIIGFFFPPSSFGNEKRVFLMTESYHTASDYDIVPSNNHNIGLGYEYTGDNTLGWHTGIYYNSYSETSLFIGVHVEKPITDNLKYSVTLSGATGYSHLTGNSIQPLLMFGMQYYFIRVVTNYPLPELVNAGSVFNLQLVYDF